VILLTLQLHFLSVLNQIPLFFQFYCTDEANALTLWKRKDAVALKQLIEFLKRSCKEEHLAHVILATSEFVLVSWLESRRCFSFVSIIDFQKKLLLLSYSELISVY